MSNSLKTQAYISVTGVQDDIVEVSLTKYGIDKKVQLIKNEVIYILPSKKGEKGRQEKLQAEILRVQGNKADAQVYEDTIGIAVGDTVEKTDNLLSVELGPGLLGQVYDGLQNPLPEIAAEFGTFLPRGTKKSPLNVKKKWAFQPVIKAGETVVAGDVLGKCTEGRIQHSIMVPFDFQDKHEVIWISEGNFTTQDVIALLKDTDGTEYEIKLSQRWPIRIPINQALIKSGICHQEYPSEPLITTQRLIDTFFPIARGGTACIPGPFGAGKTVLQNLISRHSSVDIVVVVACGERAGEVVETINEFPRIVDPQTGGTLMDRTIIICNTSSMPVAAREASIYTGITIGEYFQQMGLNVLLIADSTSRWAQAIRETSGRLEEIPGEEGYPAYLGSYIKALYERAGLIKTNNGNLGSLTMIGTVSPAGGNFDEPVTQSTLSTVKCFLGLSADRAYKRFYPAVDPLLSWSRYPDQLANWFENYHQRGWMTKVNRLQDLLISGDSVQKMMQVTGQEGVSLMDYIDYQKAMFVDLVYLQQDAFDPVDSSNTLERQASLFELVYKFAVKDYNFNSKETARVFFTELSDKMKNLNYAATQSAEYKQIKAEIISLF